MQVGHHLLCEQCNSHTIGNRGVAVMTARIPRIYSWEYVKNVFNEIIYNMTPPICSITHFILETRSNYN